MTKNRGDFEVEVAPEVKIDVILFFTPYALFYFFLKDKDLDIRFLDKNQEDDKIACGLGKGYLSFHSSFVC